MDIADAVSMAADVIAQERSAANLADPDGWSDWDAGRAYSKTLDGLVARAINDRLVLCHVPEVPGYAESWGYSAGEVLDQAAGSLFGSPYQVPPHAEIKKYSERSYVLEW